MLDSNYTNQVLWSDFADAHPGRTKSQQGWKSEGWRGEQLKIPQPCNACVPKTWNRELKIAAFTCPLPWQEIQKAEQMKKWKERLEKKYYSTEIQDDYQPVTQEEFRE